MPDNPLGAEFWNPILDEWQRWAVETRDNLLREFYADGYPVGTEKRSPREMYDRLVQLSQEGAPEYWQSAEAQAALTKLEARFGPAPPPPMPAPQPFTPQVI